MIIPNSFVLRSFLVIIACMHLVSGNPINNLFEQANYNSNYGSLFGGVLYYGIKSIKAKELNLGQFTVSLYIVFIILYFNTSTDSMMKLRKEM